MAALRGTNAILKGTARKTKPTKLKHRKVEGDQDVQSAALECQSCRIKSALLKRHPFGSEKK